MSPEDRTSAASVETGRTQAGHPGAINPADAMTQNSQIDSERKVPWTRERLAASIESITRGKSIFTSIRPFLQLADRLAPEDIPMAMALVKEMKESNSHDGIEIFGVLATVRWAETDPAAAGEYLEKNGGFDGFLDFGSEVLFQTWGEKDPLAAVAWAKRMKDNGARERATDKLLTVLARQDVNSALAFARTHFPELVKDGKVPSAITEAVKDLPPPEAARQLAQLGNVDQLENVAFYWIKKDRAAAMGWAQSLQNTQQKEAALNGMMASWAKEDLAAASKAILEQEQTGLNLAKAASSLAREWPIQDLAGLQAWAAKLPGSASRKEAYQQIGSRLAESKSSSLTQATDWLESLPSGPERDAAVSQFATGVVQKDGPAAMQWAMTIGSKEIRESALRSSMREWFREDGPAAYEWLQANESLTPDEKRAMLRR